MLHLLCFLGNPGIPKNHLHLQTPKKNMPFFEDEVVPFSGDEVVVFYMLQLILPETNSNKHLKIGSNCPKMIKQFTNHPWLQVPLLFVSFREGSNSFLPLLLPKPF